MGTQFDVLISHRNVFCFFFNCYVTFFILLLTCPPTFYLVWTAGMKIVNQTSTKTHTCAWVGLQGRKLRWTFEYKLICQCLHSTGDTTRLRGCSATRNNKCYFFFSFFNRIEWSINIVWKNNREAVNAFSINHRHHLTRYREPTNNCGEQ